MVPNTNQYSTVVAAHISQTGNKQATSVVPNGVESETGAQGFIMPAMDKRGAPRRRRGRRKKEASITYRNNSLRSDIGCVVDGTGDVGWRKNQEDYIPNIRSEYKKPASSIIFEQIL